MCAQCLGVKSVSQSTPAFINTMLSIRLANLTTATTVGKPTNRSQRSPCTNVRHITTQSPSKRSRRLTLNHQQVSVIVVRSIFCCCNSCDLESCAFIFDFILFLDAIDDPNVSYTSTVVEGDESSSEQAPVEPSDLMSQQHVAVVTQEDGTQQQVSPLILKMLQSIILFYSIHIVITVMFRDRHKGR